MPFEMRLWIIQQFFTLYSPSHATKRFLRLPLPNRIALVSSDSHGGLFTLSAKPEAPGCRTQYII